VQDAAGPSASPGPLALEASPGRPVALELAEDPPGPQLAAQLVSDVLDERAGGPMPTGRADAEPSAEPDTRVRALRAGRWVVVTVVAAVVLALLFPLAVRAMLELVSLS